MLVYVVNKDGKPLMPTSPAKARKMLRDGEARVLYKDPFSIKLLHGSSGYMQDVDFEIDPKKIRKQMKKEREQAKAREEKGNYRKKKRRYREPKTEKNKKSKEE